MNLKQIIDKYLSKKVLVWAIGVLALVLCILTVVGVVRLSSMLRAQKDYKKLANIVQQAQEAASKPEIEIALDSVALPTESLQAESTEPVQQEVAETVPVETEPVMLAKYEALYAENPDLFGWVKIEDTKIDYPVMYAPDELEKYLYHDFYGKKFSGGTPYMDVRCTPDSENYIIYGHNMKNGTMFKHLLKYQDKKFWQNHQTVSFDTLYAEGEYEVVAAFYDRVYYTYEDCFKFYDVIELDDMESFYDAITELKKKSLYDTGVIPEYGTQLVTLVTCAYHTDNGKFVVVLAEKAEG